MRPNVYPAATRLGSAVVAAAAAVAFLLTGCSGSGGGPTIATAAHPATSVAANTTRASAPGLTDKQRFVQSMRAYAGCMRRAGYDLPDPDADGHITEHGTPLKRRIGSDPHLLPALERCSKMIVPLPPEPLTEDQLRTQRANARCMRSHGVPRYPDPVALPDSPQDNARTRLINELAASPAYQRATRICDGGGHGGQPQG